MRLTYWTDYSLRILMMCARHAERAQPVTVTEIVNTHKISRSHVMKIVQDLSHKQLLETTRGRGGGMRLMRPANEIRIGAVVRATETDFDLVECFEPGNVECQLTGRCRLQGILYQAMRSFLNVLDNVTLADLVVQPGLSLGRLPVTIANTGSH